MPPLRPAVQFSLGTVTRGPKQHRLGLGRIRCCGAAFDTRLTGPAAFTGHASKAIAKLLDRHGLTEIAPAQSFLVTKDNRLQPGEEDRAEQWGRDLATKLPTAAAFR